MGRSLLWFVALVAFVMSSLGTTLAHTAVPIDRTTSADCPDHAPPPDCPAQDTAKHAAGQCCPSMGGVVALLPPAASAQAPAPYHAQPATIAANLTGLAFTQDPPPPRV